MRLLLDNIKLGAGTQPRAKIDEATVGEYAEAMQGGAIFPPVVVFYDGEIYYLADGFHRVDAAYKLGLDDIEAEVRQGTREDAIDYACSSIPNSKHGLRESPEDRHRRVETMIRLHPDWSLRKIEEHCGVSKSLVGQLKGGMGATVQNGQSSGLDGRTINTSNIGKTRAPDPVYEMPLEEVPTEEPARAPVVIPDLPDETFQRLREAAYHSAARFIGALDGTQKQEEKAEFLKWLESL